LIAEFAHRHVKVVLSGDGGDELFGGYEWYLPLLAGLDLKPTAANLVWLRGQALIWRVLAKAGAPVRSQREAAIRRLVAVGARKAYPDVWDRHIAFVTGLKGDRAGLSSETALRQAEAEVRRLYGPPPGLEEMDRATDFDVRCYLSGDILVKVDRAAMAHGLETRAPFLDVDLVEYVLGLAWQLRFRDSTSKYLLREACGRLWPQLVRARGKQGFGAPIWTWLQRPDVRILIERVSRPTSPLLTLLPGLASTWPRLSHQQQWTVLCLGLWLERRTECLSCLS
jgi:asparagine synthase (glutamine-hydrolysing)